MQKLLRYFRQQVSPRAKRGFEISLSILLIAMLLFIFGPTIRHWYDTQAKDLQVVFWLVVAILTMLAVKKSRA